MRVAPAWIGQDENASAVDRLGAEPDERLDALARRRATRNGGLGLEQRQDRTIERHADKRHDRRPVLANLALERGPAGHVLRGSKVVDAGAGPCNEVGDAEAPLMQAVV